ncbi:MAG: ATP-binding cassette domain-containing protein [Oceanidesulfovibrio sp.]
MHFSGATELDPGIRDALSQSLAMRTLELLALIAQVGRPEADADGAEARAFVWAYYEALYPHDITAFFLDVYEDLVASPSDLERFASTLRNRLNYPERISCLLTAYEFVAATGMSGLALRTVRTVASFVNIMPEDVAFLEHAAGMSETPEWILEKSSLLALHISHDPERADIRLPYPGLDLVAYKSHNLMLISSRHTELTDIRVLVDGHALTRTFTARITPHSTIVIGDTVLRSSDLAAYFSVKTLSPETALAIRRQGFALALSRQLKDEDIARFRMSGTRLTISQLDIKALVMVNGEQLRVHPDQMEDREVGLDDVIFVNGFKIDPREIFHLLASRRAGPLGSGRIALTIANDAKSAVHLPDNLPTRWAARLERRHGGLFFEPGGCPYQAYLNGRSIMAGDRVEHGGVLYLRDTFIEIDLENQRFESERFSFRKLSADRVSHGQHTEFWTRGGALDEISLEAEYGEMVCIMGPSGSGKSTLLKVLAGILPPDSGTITLDGIDVHMEFERLRDLIGFVPQEDLLFPNLTVFENLAYHARLRFPEIDRLEVRQRVESVLASIRMQDKAHTRVGPPENAVLSGGERKRVNIGLELLGNPAIYFLDEPTSGLSSKDSEYILEILTDIALSGRIVVSVLHQPGSRLFKAFDKVALIDKGGRLAFYGSTFEALEYFSSHGAGFGEPGKETAVECPECKTVMPELLLDRLEETLRDIDGSQLGERKHSPGYWKTRYRQKVVSAWITSLRMPAEEKLPPRRRATAMERFSQVASLASRNGMNKLRDRSSLLVTFLEAPLLGAGLGFVLRYSPAGDYSLYTNDLFRTFLFIAVIAIMFLALSGSVHEIVSDAPVFLRERMVDVPNRVYLAGKLLVLMAFALAQNALFLLPAFLLLEVRELYLQHFLYLGLVSFAGVSLGLAISSLPRLSLRAALNAVPLLLIPQIVLGGALIEYEEMNKQLRLFTQNPIPEICQLMPSRWAFEGLLVMQETGNSYDGPHGALLEELRRRKMLHEQSDADSSMPLSFEIAKLEGDLERLREERKHAFGNKNVHDAVILAERRREQLAADGVVDADDSLDMPLFVREKPAPFMEGSLPTPVFNAMVLALMGIVLNCFTLAALRIKPTTSGGRIMARRRLKRAARQVLHLDSRELE